MSWKQMASFLVLVFVLLTLRAVLAGPLRQIENALLDLGNLSNEHFDGATVISGIFDQWFLMVLLAVFLLMGVAIARVVRKELTRQAERP